MTLTGHSHYGINVEYNYPQKKALMPLKAFGDYIRELRKEKRLGLREFCLKLPVDPSQWSRIERGIENPPTDEEILVQIAAVFEIEVGSREWIKLTDLASLSRGRVPQDILSDEELMKQLPLVFRTIRGEKPTIEELKRLADLIRRG